MSTDEYRVTVDPYEGMDPGQIAELAAQRTATNLENHMQRVTWSRWDDLAVAGIYILLWVVAAAITVGIVTLITIALGALGVTLSTIGLVTTYIVVGYLMALAALIAGMQ